MSVDMDDLEQEIRELLEQRSSALPTDLEAGRVVRRARRGLALSVVGGALAVALVALGAVAGLNALGDQEPVPSHSGLPIPSPSTIGTAAIPDVMGLPLAQARLTLVGLGFHAVVERVDSLLPAGVVAGQSPVPDGRPWALGTVVHLIVSNHSSPVAVVPGVVGMSLAKAVSELAAAGFPHVHLIRPARKPYSSALRVVAQSPKHRAPVGREITLRLGRVGGSPSHT